MNITTVKIDVTQIDKSRLFEGKPKGSGEIPKYLKLVLIPRKEAGKYGETHIVKQDSTKEEREAGKELPIIGSATERLPIIAPAKERLRAQSAFVPKPPPPDEDVPF